MSILYYNNCWFTNIGEAFIDIGAMKMLQYLFPNQAIVNFSRMNYMYTTHILGGGQNHKKLDMWKYIGGDVEYVVMAGMFANEDYISSLVGSDFVNDLQERGAKVIYLGLGQCHYTSEETNAFRRYLEYVKPELVVTRDSVTYNNFKEIAPCINGIDCALWVRDSYNPSCSKPFRPYNVLTYNRSKESESALKMVGDTFVRAQHMQYSAKARHIRDNMLISDTPYDYLTLYACANEVYTDLVHATIAALQYGKHVWFERVDNRGYVIDSIGKLQQDSRGLIYIDENDLEIQKRALIGEIKKVIK